jgi:hypothetical protein
LAAGIAVEVRTLKRAMSDLDSDLRAAVLTGFIESSQIKPTAAAERRGPALYETLPARVTPLNLDAPRFRYVIRRSGHIEPVREAGRRCHQRHD